MAIAKSRGYGHSILPTWKNARGRSSPSARTCENRAPGGCLGAHGAGPVPLRPPAWSSMHCGWWARLAPTVAV